MKLDQHIISKFAYIPQQLGMPIEQKPFLVDSGLPCDMFNTVCCTGGETKEDIAKAINHFKLPFAWWVGFDADPEWLESELTGHGLEKSEAELAMAVNLKDVKWPDPIDGFSIKPVYIQDLLSVMNSVFPKEEHEAIATFFTSASELLTNPESNLQFLIGYLDGKPVATSSAYFAHDLSSVFDVITHPSARGKGIGTQMTLAAMHLGYEKGYEKCILTATNDAKFLYEKIGFKAIKEMSVFNPA